MKDSRIAAHVHTRYGPSTLRVLPMSDSAVLYSSFAESLQFPAAGAVSLQALPARSIKRRSSG